MFNGIKTGETAKQCVANVWHSISGDVSHKETDVTVNSVQRTST